MHQHLGQLGNNKHIPNGDTATQLLCWDIWLLSIVISHRFILSNYSYRYYILLSYSCGAMNVTCTLKYWVPEKQPTCTYLRIMGWLQFWAAFWYIYIYIFCMQFTNSVLLKDIQRLSICICFNTAACLSHHHDTRSTCSTNQSIPPTIIEVQKGP